MIVSPGVHKRRGAGVLALALATALTGATAASGAVATPTTVGPKTTTTVPTANPARAAELEHQIGEASAQEGAALRELDQIRSRRVALDRSVAALDGRIGAVQTRIEGYQAEITRLEAAAAELDLRVRATITQLEAARRKADDAVAALYRGDSGEAGAYARLLDVPALSEVYAGSVYLRHVHERRSEAVDTLAGLRDTIEQLRRLAGEQRDAAETARSAATAEQDQLESLRADAAAERAQRVADESREQALVAQIRQRKDEYNRELQALAVVSGDVTQLLAARQRSQTRGTFRVAVTPVVAPVTSAFGTRVHPILGTVRTHTGIDLGAGAGTTIKAAADGVVVSAGERGGYGLCVIVDHGGQYATLYGHASKLLVAAGQTVKAGAPLALVGSTGLATGPHLHFEVRVLGVPIDPAPFLAGR